MSKPRTIRLDKIRVDSGLQARCQIDEATVEAYAQAVRDQEDLPAVVVYDDGSGEYWLADGFHRDLAFRRVGMETIKAVVTKGSRRDALLFAVGANAQHGLRRTNDDKRKAVTILLNDPEWTKWSNRTIAKKASVAEATVRRIRDELTAKATQVNTSGAPKTHLEPATRIGGDGKTYPATTKEETTGNSKPAAQAQQPANASAPQKEKDVSPVKEFDAIGAPVPDHIVDVFRTRAKFSELASKLSALQKEIAELAATPAGAVYATQLVRKSAGKDSAGKEKYRHSCEHLNNARNRLLWAEPHSRCPYCHHSGKVTQGCKACHGLGWVIETVFSAAPADYVAAVLDLAKDVPPQEA